MGNQSVKGFIVSRNATKELLSQPVGIRIKEMRLKLEAIYPGEFNLKKVADELGLSENGLAKIEKGNTNVQDGTVDLSDKYFAKFNVPSRFFEKEEAKIIKPVYFYLGKQVDKLPYFDSFYEANGQKHFLDIRELHEIEDADYRYSDNSIDIYQDDVTEEEDGGPLLTQIGVEITLNAYQVSTRQPLWEKRLNQMAVISPNELHHFEKALRRDVDVLIRQYSELFSLHKQLKESQLREALLKARLYLRNQEQQTEADTDLEREISALLDEIE